MVNPFRKSMLSMIKRFLLSIFVFWFTFHILVFINIEHLLNRLTVRWPLCSQLLIPPWCPSASDLPATALERCRSRSHTPTAPGPVGTPRSNGLLARTRFGSLAPGGEALKVYANCPQMFVVRCNCQTARWKSSGHPSVNACGTEP